MVEKLLRITFKILASPEKGKIMTRCYYLVLYLQNTPSWPMSHVTNSLESYESKYSNRKNKTVKT